jgi:FkbM family methyltransferase
MKQVNGIYLPDDDTHFAKALTAAPQVDGKATYQLRKIDMCLAVTERKRTALDIGAHVGLWSMILVKHFQTVEAFEPVPTLRECWKKNLEGVTNAYIRPVALGATCGDSEMVYIDGNSGNSRVMMGGGVQVKMLTVDSMMCDSVDFIKIDVEGYEYEVLQGARETIVFWQPVVLIEQKPGNAEKFGRKRFAASDLLQSWGMSKLWEKAGDCCYGWEV